MVTRWAPDRIPAVWSRAGEGRIYVMSALGGGDSKLSDFSTEDLLAWSPDGRFVAAARVERAGANNISSRSMSFHRMAGSPVP